MQTADAMRAVLSWGPVSKDLDFNSVEYNKVTKATCWAYWGQTTCPGSKWLNDNMGVSSINDDKERERKI